MKKNFVTLFNSAYLSRGLVMYRSLEKVCPDFHLYVIAFDDVTYNYFEEFPEKFLTVIPLSQFEDAELLRIKPTRTAAEYCWTSTPSTVLYCINRFNLDHCVYIDADMFFYSDPSVLFDEWGSRSVLITEHRFTKEYDQSVLNGIYCVQFVGFKNDPNGMEALRWWRNACLEWCYARTEDGKFGDQKYLDDWTTRFKGVHVLQHLGGGVAPWNMQQYHFFKDELGVIKGKELLTSKTFRMVFFHFHGVKFYSNGVVRLTGSLYARNKNAELLFYFPYIAALQKVKTEVILKHPGINVDGANSVSGYLPLTFVDFLKEYVKGCLRHPKNIFGLSVIRLIQHDHVHHVEALKNK